MNMEQLRNKVIELHPWHLKVEIRDGLSTDCAREVPESQLPEHDGCVAFSDKEQEFKQLVRSIYPGGLSKKSFLDCACNCGGFSFWARDLGADRTFGFDVRKHWIRQANFLRKHRAFDTRGIKFKQCDLYEVPRLRLRPFDITWFRGIFYHLPDPVRGIQIAADLTNELMYVDTATAELQDSEDFSGGLMASFEGIKSPMSGVHRLNWLPTGPKVMRHILKWLGFVETKVVWHSRSVSPPGDSGIFAGRKGRIGILAAKKRGLISHRKDVYPDNQD